MSLNPLFIIEAPGKVKLLKNLLQGLFDSAPIVFATKGRLYDLPGDEYGISKEDNVIAGEWVPISRSTISSLEAFSSKASIIYVMTDDDIEGEVIAAQVISLVSKKTTAAVQRLKVKRFTHDAVLRALGNPTDLDEVKVSAGVSRRLFDRMIGFGISNYDTNNTMGSVGRILSPLLEAVAKLPNEKAVGVINRTVRDSNSKEEVYLSITVPKSKKDGAISLAADVSELPGEVSLVEDGVFELCANPWNCADALLKGSLVTGESVVTVSERMQRLYERGHISYPRSDSRVLDIEDCRVANRIGHSNGLTGFSMERLLAKKEKNLDSERRTQDAHSAVVPLSSYADLSVPLADKQGDDLLYGMITKNLINVGLSAKESRFSLSLDENQEWFDYLVKNNLEITIVEARQPNSDFDHSLTLSSKESEVLREVSLRRSPNKTSLYMYPKDYLVLECMVDIGAGRPSTYPIHASNVSGRFMEESLDLNGLGYLSLGRAKEALPGLVVPSLMHQIEECLHSDSGTVESRLEQALSLLGKNISEFAQDVVVMPKDELPGPENTPSGLR